MIRHLTPADYTEMAWANGGGVTVEMLRVNDGALRYRFSHARVTKDGAFSIFPQTERSLTVISGPGFDLKGHGVSTRAALLQPVAFAGDIEISAANVTDPCDDFNVMTAREMPRPDVSIVRSGHVAAGGVMVLFALQDGLVNGVAVGRNDLFVSDVDAHLDGHFILTQLNI